MYQDYLGTTKYDYYQLVHAARESGQWNFEIPGTCGDVVGGAIPIAFDSLGKAHIMHNGAETDWPLKYTTNATGAWETSLVEDNGMITGPDMVLDQDGYLHVNFAEFLNHDLMYATNKSGSWVMESVDEDEYTGYGNRIALDSTGGVHMCEIRIYHNELRYVTNASGQWVVEVLEDQTNPQECDITVDGNDEVHIVYTNYNPYTMHHFHKASGAWSVERVDGDDFLEQIPMIETDENGSLFIVYHDNDNDDLILADNAEGSWRTRVVDAYGNVGRYQSMVIAENDIHLVYAGEDAIWYAMVSKLP